MDDVPTFEVGGRIRGDDGDAVPLYNCPYIHEVGEGKARMTWMTCPHLRFVGRIRGDDGDAVPLHKCP